MTDALLDTVPISVVAVAEIIVPPDRQRRDAKADEALLNSIRTVGLINPIIIRENLTLVAGERRLNAFKQLGRASIPARFFEALSPLAAFLIELQENMARKQLTWQEEVKAIAAFHEMRLASFAGWTVQGTASDIGISTPVTYRMLAVAKYLDDPDVNGAATFAGAMNLIEARADRSLAAASARGLLVGSALSLSLPPRINPDATREEKTQALLDSMTDNLEETAFQTGDVLDKLERGDLAAKALRAAAEVERTTSDDNRILHGSFLEWAPNYTGPRFDVIHCDFPYGKGYSGSNTRKTGRATSVPTYGDQADIYFALVECFLAEQERFALPEAHCIFWFDMMHYCWTVEQFKAAGWSLVQPFPLVWTKSYQGVASDTARRPRHCYETALLFSLGDRKLRNLDKDHFEEQVDEKLHMSQKPIKMLKHFLNLVVDEHTAVLDPTCGSGTGLAAAGQLGANRLLGIEIEESNADVARFILDRELPNAPS